MRGIKKIKVVGAKSYQHQQPKIYRGSRTPPFLPNIKLSTNNTKKIKNKILAIPAAPAATPPKPNMAAMMATIRKITVQRNIGLIF
jgi:hypothetical protein